MSVSAILDELHTYRGRQGADVATLMRRLRDRLCQDKAPVCIGTSATMASEGSDDSRAAAVADVASRLFGTHFAADAVIDESLERATDSTIKIDGSIKRPLRELLNAEIDPFMPDETLKTHPLAAWIEMEIGLEDGQKLTRRRPATLGEAAKRL